MSLGMLKLYKLVLLIFVGTLLSANTTMEFNHIKKGVQDENTLLVIGGIQGDEPGGFISASLLATHYEITKGSVWIVPNLNFYSIIKRSRGPYGDMNRKFAYLSKKDPEYKTVERIKNLIKDDRVKLIVNLHDGSGFYREKYVDSMHSPHRWGQASIIDQKKIDVEKYGNLEDISRKVVKHVNNNLLKSKDIYTQHNTKTKDGDKEMEKSLTYFAINNGKSAFGNEASKNLPTHKRVYYHLLALEKYMDIMGIEYKRDFNLTAKGVYGAINNDIYISFYNNKINLPLDNARHTINYFPIKENEKIDFKASNPLTTVIKTGDNYAVYYGNRKLSNLKADYQKYDIKDNGVDVQIDGINQNVKFGSIIDVKKWFLIKSDKKYRINVIGYTNKKKIETDIKIRKSNIINRFSIDKKGKIYRVEYYRADKFVGMILMRFR